MPHGSPQPWCPPGPCNAHLPAPLSAQLLALHPGYRLTTQSKELGWVLRRRGHPGSSRGSRPGAHEGVRGSPVTVLPKKGLPGILSPPGEMSLKGRY